MSSGLERFLLDHGESVVRLAPHLMVGARTGVRERGKSDPIDGLAVARAALREGIENLAVACLTGPELEIRLLTTHRDRLVNQRTRCARCSAIYEPIEIDPTSTPLESQPIQDGMAERSATD